MRGYLLARVVCDEMMLFGGLHMETRESLGRVLVADRHFVIGDVVVEEEPLLVWVDDAHRCESMVRAFLAAPVETQAAILDMGHPLFDDESVPFVAVARKEAAALAASHADFADMGTVRLVELLLIDATNAHSYHGGARTGNSARSALVFISADVDIDVDVDAPSLPPPQTPAPRVKQCAIFAFASKVAHACRPNTVYTSTGTGGRLRYIASRSIAPGDLITFSYIEALQPRAARRAALLDGKFFHCECARCMDADDCRGLRCALTVDCGGTLLHYLNGNWACTACGAAAQDSAPALASLLTTEASASDAVFWLKSRLDAGDAEIPIAIIEATVVGAAARLPLSHYAIIAGVRVLVGVYMGEARAAAAAGAGEAAAAREFYLKSATAGALRVRLLECLEAQCRAGGACTADHGPALGAVIDALWATYDAVASGFPLGLAARYVALLRARFGDADVDVIRVTGIINAIALAPPLLPPQISSVAAAAALVFQLASPRLLADALPIFASCAACGADKATSRCSRCHKNVYCGDACQRRDWPTHKLACSPTKWSMAK